MQDNFHRKKSWNFIKIILLCVTCYAVYAIFSKTVDIDIQSVSNQKITDSPSYIKIKNTILNGTKEIADNKILSVKNNKKSLKITLFHQDYNVTVSSKLINFISPTPKLTSGEISEKELNQYAKKILSKIIKKNMSDAAKVKAVHDYIVLNTEYDIDNVNNGTIPDSDYTVEGVLLDGKAVCQGYAYAFQFFMNNLKMESRIVTGTDLKTGVGHAWNMVCLKGTWYQIDTTWDDPVPDQKGRIQYHYFLMTDQTFEADHSWDKDKFPSCTSKKYLYYVYKDDIIKSVKQYEKAFMKKYNAGERTITLLYPEKVKPDMHFLLNYNNTRKKENGRYTVSYHSMDPWRLGDYTVFTVIME